MSEISPEKHSKKKSSPPPDSLFPVAPAAFTLAATAKALDMFPITGLTDAQLRQIALQKNPANGAPWFPKPARSRWDTVAVLRGLADRREHLARQAATPRLEDISFPSMESCEGATGITRTIQSLAKSHGCTAFRGSRVYLLPLIQWIFREAAAGQVADWGKMNEELDAKLKWCELESQIGVEGRPGKLVKREDVEAHLRDLTALFFGALKRLKLEIPRDFEMRPKDYIKSHMDEKHRQLLSQLTHHLEKFIGEPPVAPVPPQLETK